MFNWPCLPELVHLRLVFKNWTTVTSEQPDALTVTRQQHQSMDRKTFELQCAWHWRKNMNYWWTMSTIYIPNVCKLYRWQDMPCSSHWQYIFNHAVHRLALLMSLLGWRGSAMGRALDFAIGRSRVQILLEAMLCNNLGQVVYTYVPLSPSSITWYRPKGGDALQLEG